MVSSRLPAVVAPLSRRIAFFLAMLAVFAAGPAPAGAQETCESWMIICDGETNDTQAPFMFVSPNGGVFGSTRLVVRIYFCDDRELNGASASATWNGQPLNTSQSRWPSPWSNGLSECAGRAQAHGDTIMAGMLFTDTVTMVPGENYLSARVCDSYTRCTDMPPVTFSYDSTLFWVNRVAVTPDFSERMARASRSDSLGYYVTNHMGMPATFTMLARCAANVITPGSSCVPDPSSVYLEPGQSAPVKIRLTSASSESIGQRGTFRLVAAYAPRQIADSGATDVEIVPAPGAVRLVGSASLVAPRELCVSISAGPGAAYQCGDLRLAHGLPVTTILNTARAPTLLYSSAMAHPFPLIPALIAPPQGAPGTDSVIATLSVAGVREDSARWSVAQLDDIMGSQVVLGYDARSRPTGVYPYTITVHHQNGAAQRAPHGSFSGELVVINRESAALGAGWGLAGVEQIFFNVSSNRRLWVGGDGSYAVYSPVGGNRWVAPSIDAPDTLVYEDLPAPTYTRTLKGRTRVIFDGQGRHIKTVNAMGRTTTFVYPDGVRLAEIRVPLRSPNSYVTYSLEYTGGMLARIVAPPVGGTQRATLVSIEGSTLRSITDPDGSIVRFGYDGGSPTRVVSRTDRRNYVRYFRYDLAGKLITDSVPNAGGGIPAVTRYRAAESRGYHRVEPPLAWIAATTTLDGARTDVADITTIWVGAFGAPSRVRDPLGATTTLYRDDWRFPALVTRTVAPDGVVTTATYTERGNLAESSILNALGGSEHSTTRYTWDGYWDKVTLTTLPTGEVSSREYHSTWGVPLWEQAGTSAATRVHFNYTSDGLVSSVVTPLGRRDSLEYDPGTGNVSATITPRGGASRVWRDAVGRDTLSVDITGRSTRTVYDLADQDTLVVASAEGQSIEQRKTYDREGNLEQHRQRSIPDPNAIGVITNSWVYDPLGRQTTATFPNNSQATTQYNPAGHVTSTVTRRGETITMTYDAAGRLITRDVPRTPRQLGTWRLPTFTPRENPGPLSVPEERARFTYDRAGRLLTARNMDAWVTRTYFPNGLLKTETQQIQGVYTPTLTPPFRYDLAYSYDLSGRRRTFAGRTYEYDGLGRLRTLTDPVIGTYRFAYTLDGQIDTLHFPGGAYEASGYDPDGNRKRRHELVQGLEMHKDSLVHDLAGRLERVEGQTLGNSGTGMVPTTASMEYTGMGALKRQQRQDPSPVQPTNQTIVLDALANRVRVVEHQSEMRTAYRYQPGTGQLLSSEDTLVGVASWDMYAYDTAGNQITTEHTSGNYWDARALSYRADGKLWAVERRACIYQGPPYSNPPQCLWANQNTGSDPGHGRRGVWEEYRYDALGRRVLVITEQMHQYCSPGQDCDQGIQRTVWDGEQIHMEVRVLPAGSDGVDKPDTYTTADRPWRFGIVTYVHAGGIDQPLGIIRRNYYQSGPVRAFSLHRNWEGLAGTGSYGDGTRLPNCGESSPATCFAVAWPAIRFGSFRNPNEGYIGSPTWQGTLLAEKTDLSGQAYMRNRYYDGRTGRFTQEDPIGLAGGLNVYGYAAGDPVNFGDPFGLSPAKIIYGDVAAQAATEACAQASAQCKRMVEELDADESVWLIETGAIRNDDPFASPQSGMTYVHGGPDWGPFEGGVIRIDPSKFAISQSNLGVPVNDVTVRSHELGHALIATAFYRGGRNSTVRLNDACPVDDCATVIENIVRGERKLPLRSIRPKTP